MKFSNYYASSWGLVLALLSYSMYAKEQFYPIILFLATSKFSYVVLGNLLLANAFFLAGVMKTLFLGSLSDSEIEMLIDRAKYTITETCLALTIFRNELTPPILGLFGTLLFVKAFHWLARNRVDRLDQIMPTGYGVYTRLVALLLVLLACDMTLCYTCVDYTVVNGKSILILFSFEFGLLVISVCSISIRFMLYVRSTRPETLSQPCPSS
jgi:E3 ubiquitin-protein ligase synoviolin